MNGGGATFYRYRLPLRRPLQLRDVTLDERTGILVCLRSPSGNVGWGEVAPLPGFSEESLEQALRQAGGVAATVVYRNLDDDEPRFTGLRRQDSFHSSVRFGMESALLSLRAANAGTHPARLLSDSPPDRIAVNALLTGTGKSVIDDAVKLAERGYIAVKLKVGRARLQDEAAIVRDLRAELPGTVAIRLDANRAWDFDDACDFSAGIQPDSIAYVEEPLADPGRLPELRAKTGIPYAVDETLQDIGWRVVSSLREHGKEELDLLPAYPQVHLVDAVLHATAWVVKPTLLGAPLEFYSSSAPSHGYGGPVVVSSSFETGMGLVSLANLAAAANHGSIPVGLDTQFWLADDTLEEDLIDVNGTCDVIRACRLAASPKLNVLEEIAHV